MDSNAVYHDISPKLKWVTRLSVVGCIVLGAVAGLVLIIEALAKTGDSNDDAILFLFFINLVFSFIVGFFIVTWYLKSELDVSYWWVVCLTAILIGYQSLAGIVIATGDFGSAGYVAATTPKPIVTVKPLTLGPIDMLIIN